jgi:hypothetical protein
MAVENLPASPTLRALGLSFRRHLQSANRSPKTVRCYMASLDSLSGFLEAQGMPTHATAVRREHIESYVIARMEHVKASSVLPGTARRCPERPHRSRPGLRLRDRARGDRRGLRCYGRAPGDQVARASRDGLTTARGCSRQQAGRMPRLAPRKETQR